MFHNDSRQPIFRVKRSKIKVTTDKRRGSLHSCECWLLLGELQCRRLAQWRAVFSEAKQSLTTDW